MTSDIDSYCRKNVNDEYYITAELFIFNNIVNIFDHLGILSLLESSEMIIDTLKKNSAQDSRCYALSLKEYIVLSKLMKGDKTHNQKNKNIEFLYQDISIPFATITFKIDTENSIYNLWEKVFVFEEYISSGDIK